ncbi:molecular chaperone HtpG [Collinsella sp. AGMB00827]|uniref:Chaperone protein HtpG n=1 Tax=Collinsella ureilytica TaxID=2869515 RepID=A0ABS7MJB6_9ACTN|nr:molecular chaperone HtpG [Collinsella urealyticum]MBY4797181.1 molecular chaperone HtpG [Collinsella urealyticum]
MRKFKTESKKLLDLMINSIYTNREIFLRELISNASDAVDKLNFKGLTDSSVQVDQDSLAIRLSVDPEARTLTVSDNGIGMTADELERNLGTIAHSGSQEFKSENAEHQGNTLDIIGQFGVGFYSAFMVAKKVRVVSRAFGEDVAHVWESDGLEGYTISEGERETHGTDVILTLRDNLPGEQGEPGESFETYLTEWGLKDLVRRYSNYVRYPIQMLVTKSRPKPEPAKDDEQPSSSQTTDAQGDSSAEHGTASASDSEGKADASDVAHAADASSHAPEYEEYEELETLNSMTPIWKKRSSEVEDEEYAEFYKSTFHDWEAPARTISFHAEGTLEYDALLFIPGKAPFDLYSREYEKGLALYSSNVMIMEKCADLLPDHFNFVRGIVDSADVSLNISRETLQQDRQLRAIASRIEKKIGSELAEMRDKDREAYETFFENFGRGLKFGIYSSYGMKASELADLLLFWSARENRMVTLDEYARSMPAGQTAIYFAAGDDRTRLSKMPVVRSVLSRGYDVLLCTADVDEFTLQAMRVYEAKGLPKVFEDETARAAAETAVADGAEPELEDRSIEFKNVASGDIDLASEDEKKTAEEATRAHKDLFQAMKEALDGKVERVSVSARLVDAPAAITTEGPVSLEMEKVMARGPEAEGADLPRSVRVLELNAEHPVFAKLTASFEQKDQERLSLYTGLLYDQALLVEGMLPEDPVAFAERICELM